MIKKGRYAKQGLGIPAFLATQSEYFALVVSYIGDLNLNNQ